jgi:hypothetical protein
MKYTDVTGRLQWFADLKANTPGNAEVHRYCDAGAENLGQIRTAVLGRPLLSGWEHFADRTFDKTYLDTVKYDTAGIYQGSFLHEHVTLAIPSEFSGML